MMNLAQIGMMGFTQTSFLLEDLTDDTPLLFDAANIKTMFQETVVGEISNEVTADGQSVGTWLSKGFGGFVVSTTSNTNRPTLGSGGGFNSYITWGASSVVLRNISSAMKAYVRPLHAVSPAYSVMLWVKINTDGTTKQMIATSSTGLTTVAGIRFLQLSTGALTLRQSNGTATTLNFTTTGTITSASGWVPIIITQNGTGAGSFSVYIGAAAAETASPTAGAAVDAALGLEIGAPGMSIARIEVLAHVATAQERSDFQALNPARNTDFWAAKAIEFDMQSSCFSDVAWTTPATNGQAIRGLKNLTTSPFGAITLFNGTTASGGASPTFIASSTGGRGAASFDGTGTAQVTIGTDMFPEAGTASFSVVVFQNLDASNGSHVLADSPEYWVWVGTNYGGGGAGKHLVHINPGVLDGLDLPNGAEQPNVGAWYRFAAESYLATTLAQYTESGLTGRINCTNLGATAQGADWYPHGPLSYYIIWRGYFSKPYRDAEISRLKTLFGL